MNRTVRDVFNISKFTVISRKGTSQLFRRRWIYQGRRPFSKSVLHLKLTQDCGTDSVEHGYEVDEGCLDHVHKGQLLHYFEIILQPSECNSEKALWSHWGFSCELLTFKAIIKSWRIIIPLMGYLLCFGIWLKTIKILH